LKTAKGEHFFFLSSLLGERRALARSEGGERKKKEWKSRRACRSLTACGSSLTAPSGPSMEDLNAVPRHGP